MAIPRMTSSVNIDILILEEPREVVAGLWVQLRIDDFRIFAFLFELRQLLHEKLVPHPLVPDRSFLSLKGDHSCRPVEFRILQGLRDLDEAEDAAAGRIRKKGVDADG